MSPEDLRALREDMRTEMHGVRDMLSQRLDELHQDFRGLSGALEELASFRTWIDGHEAVTHRLLARQDRLEERQQALDQKMYLMESRGIDMERARARRVNLVYVVLGGVMVWAVQVWLGW
jgi:hypothetical protein